MISPASLAGPLAALVPVFPVVVAGLESIAGTAGQWGPGMVGGLVGGLVGARREVRAQFSALLAAHVATWHTPRRKGR